MEVLIQFKIMFFNFVIQLFNFSSSELINQLKLRLFESFLVLTKRFGPSLADCSQVELDLHHVYWPVCVVSDVFERIYSRILATCFLVFMRCQMFLRDFFVP